MPKTLVILPGWGFNSNIWQEVIQDFTANNYKIIVLDLPAKILELDKLIKLIIPKLPIKANYLGWSLGGLILIRLAQLYPEYIQQVFLAGTNPKFTEVLGDNYWPGISTKVFNSFFKLLQLNYQSTMSKFVSWQFPLAETGGSEKLTKFLANAVPNNPNIKILKFYLLVLQYTDLRLNLCQLKCPVQMLFAEHDQLVPIEVSEKIAQLGNNNIKINIIANAGHAMFLTHKAEVYRIINNA